MLGFMDGVRVQRQIESINRDIQQIKEVQLGLLTLQKETNTLSQNIARDVTQETREDIWKGKKQQEYKDMYESLDKTLSMFKGDIGQQVYYMEYWIYYLEGERSRLMVSLHEMKEALKKQESTK
ncbi:hypothetical protein SAMN04488137_3449 [Fictibacillus solisalsi]|uniref:DUF5082 domain-containing protein n=1 Tax=Fictibacillus solisalsi TaxID=459525 RepID=A0A1G9YJQ0_9BACL|nr:hypothetical protein [Fictibacillus solisalsi]SDN08746.1 hypothetical protein SAMN04488137_3449 [Fictibacillus solisalsi]